MLDVGMSELIVIFIVALLVFGPRRLPELSKALGKGLAEIKKSLNDAKKQVETEFRAIEKQEKGKVGEDFADFKKTLQDVKRQVENGYKGFMATPIDQEFLTATDKRPDQKKEEMEEVEEERKEEETEKKEKNKEEDKKA